MAAKGITTLAAYRAGARSAQRPRGRARRKNMTLSLAMIGGFVPTALFGLQTMKEQGPEGGLKAVTMRLTGYNAWVGNWYFSELLRGWTPILAGMFAHKVANRLGINRALSRAGVPLIRI